MKLSLDLPDDRHPNPRPLFKAKLPISIFNNPFTSIFTSSALTTVTAANRNAISDPSFSLSTNFPSGPSLKLTYSASPTAINNSPIFPFSLSLKSGLGLFGSPKNSPLTFSANFSLSSTTPNAIIPTFSLHFKPQLGGFSLHRRSSSSSSNPDPDNNYGYHFSTATQVEANGSSSSELGNGFASDGSSGWQELKLEPLSGKEKAGFADSNLNPVDGYGMGFLPDRKLAWGAGQKVGSSGGSGASIKARTVLPLTKGLLVNLRWGVHLPGNFATKLPYLALNKIGIERVKEVKEVKKLEEKSSGSKGGDLELLKGLCFWMSRDLELLEQENRVMKRSLEDMRVGVLVKNPRGESNAVGKKVAPDGRGVSEFEQWKNKKGNGEGSGQGQPKKPANQVTDLETELQRAIKAASS